MLKNLEVNNSSIPASRSTTEPEQLKQPQTSPQDRQKHLTPNTTPLPSAKTRTPPSIEREPVHKKLLLSSPKAKKPESNMEARPTTIRRTNYQGYGRNAQTTTKRATAE